MSKYLILVINLVFLVNFSKCMNKTECFHKKTKVLGECVPIKKCGGVEEDLKNNIPPQICSFKKGTVLVCCPKKQEIDWFRTLSTQDELIITTTEKVPQTFSEKKCEEFLRISGESEASGGYPYFVSLGYQNGTTIDWSCSGTLISKNFILTAAHCLENVSVVQTGSNFRKYPQLELKKTYKYPFYNETHHDIGLLELKEPVIFSEHVKPACLPTSFETLNQNTSVITQSLLEVGNETTSHVTNTYFNPTEECYSHTDGCPLCCGTVDISELLEGKVLYPLQDYDKTSSVHRIVGFVTKSGSNEICFDSTYTRISKEYIEWIENVVWDVFSAEEYSFKN